MYGAIWPQGKTVFLIWGKEDVLPDPNPKAMLIVKALFKNKCMSVLGVWQLVHNSGTSVRIWYQSNPCKFTEMGMFICPIIEMRMFMGPIIEMRMFVCPIIQI